MITAVEQPGLALYVRFDDASNTAVDMTERSGLDVGIYDVADAAIQSAGLLAGTYVPRIFSGTAAGQTADDALIAVPRRFVWTGTAEAGSSNPSAVDIRTEMDTNSSKLSSILTAIGSLPSNATIASRLLTTATIDGKTVGWYLAKIAAALLYKTSGNTGAAGVSQTEVIRNLADSSDSYTVTTDSNRNRTEFTDGAAPSVTP